MGKKIVIISTTPRKNGNSEILATEFMRGLKEDIKGYIDCYNDKKLKGTLFAGGVNDINEVKSYKNYMKKAYDMGKKIK